MDRDIIPEHVILTTIESFNNIDSDDKKINNELELFLEWIRNVVAYYILINPYRVRNPSELDPNLKKFAK